MELWGLHDKGFQRNMAVAECRTGLREAVNRGQASACAVAAAACSSAAAQPVTPPSASGMPERSCTDLVITWIPKSICFTVIDGLQPSSYTGQGQYECQGRGWMQLWKHIAKHSPACNQSTAHIYSHKLRLTSLRMLRQTVPDGYTLGWKKLAGNLHCTGIEEPVKMVLCSKIIQHLAHATLAQGAVSYCRRATGTGGARAAAACLEGACGSAPQSGGLKALMLAYATTHHVASSGNEQADLGRLGRVILCELHCQGEEASLPVSPGLAWDVALPLHQVS